jgi:hypothetical protein
MEAPQDIVEHRSVVLVGQAPRDVDHLPDRFPSIAVIRQVGRIAEPIRETTGKLVELVLVWAGRPTFGAAVINGDATSPVMSVGPKTSRSNGPEAHRCSAKPNRGRPNGRAAATSPQGRLTSAWSRNRSSARPRAGDRVRGMGITRRRQAGRSLRSRRTRPATRESTMNAITELTSTVSGPTVVNRLGSGDCRHGGRRPPLSACVRMCIGNVSALESVENSWKQVFRKRSWRRPLPAAILDSVDPGSSPSTWTLSCSRSRIASRRTTT